MKILNLNICNNKIRSFKYKRYKNRIEYSCNSKRHRTDGPAVERSNGEKHWYKEGRLHRTDGSLMESV